MFTQVLSLALSALMIAPAVGLPQPANADRGTGRVLAQLPQCGSEDENHTAPWLGFLLHLHRNNINKTVDYQ